MMKNLKLTIFTISMLCLITISKANNVLFAAVETDEYGQQYSIMECPLSESDGVPIYCRHDGALTHEQGDVSHIAINPDTIAMNHQRYLYLTDSEETTLTRCNTYVDSYPGSYPKINGCRTFNIRYAGHDLGGMAFSSDGTKLYLVDRENKTIRVCTLNTTDGTPIDNCPEIEDSRGNAMEFEEPLDVAIAANNSVIIIADRMAGGVILCPLQNYSVIVGRCTVSNANWEIMAPEGVAVDSNDDDKLYVATQASYTPSFFCNYSVVDDPFKLYNCSGYKLGSTSQMVRTSATQVVLSNDNRYAYFINRGNGTFYIDKLKKTGEIKSSTQHFYLDSINSIAYY